MNVFHLNLQFSSVGNQMKVGCILMVVVFFTAIDSRAQDSGYEIRSGFYTATETQLPFWFYSNVKGKVDPRHTNFLNEFLFQTPLYTSEELTVRASGNAVIRISGDHTVFFPDLSLRATAFGLRLDAGRFSQPIGLNNHELSVGSMMFGNHHTPVPKISVSTSSFADIPFTRGHIQFSGMFSHGWFETNRHISDPFLHQKYFYLRVNAGPLSGTGGVIHNAMWGGRDPRYGRLPQSFGDYLRVISGLGAAEQSNLPEGEIWNVIGNSVAGYEFDLLYKNDAFNISINRLFYLEDKVSTRFRSPWDGVWTADVSLNQKDGLLSAFTYQHFNTKQQDSRPDQLIGRQSYYNHYFYLSGWSYENKVLGIPTIIYDEEIERVVDNIMVGHHTGFKGKIMENVDYKMLFTYARHYGTVTDRTQNDGDIIPLKELRRDQYSWLLVLDYNVQKTKELQFNLKLGSDFGEFFEDNLGLMLGVTWNGEI